MTCPVGLLSGLKALDLSQYIPGPYATRMLSDQGAEVIKVEPPAGDPMRTLFFTAGRSSEADSGDKSADKSSAVSPIYQTLNRGKRILFLDLKSSQDKQKFIALAQHADMVLESFRPGVMARLGLDWPSLRAINPRLIYCSLSGYGQTGRYRERAGHDINYCAAAGLYSLPLGRPKFAFPPLADHAAAMLAANSMLAALYARGRDGGGRYLDVSIYESALAFRYLSNFHAAGFDVAHVDFLGGGAACYNLYETADQRFVTLGAVEGKFWRAFCAAMGEPDWGARQYEALPQRELIAVVQARFAARPLAYWEATLRGVDCCYEAVPADHLVLQHPQTLDRRLAAGHDIRYPAWLDGKPVTAAGPLQQMDSTAAGWLTT